MGRLSRRAIGLLTSVFVVAALSAGVAGAAPKAVEAFDTGTWKSLQGSLKQPTVVVFTATWCATCPMVMEELARQIRQRKVPATMVAVVMDVTPGSHDAALLKNAHYVRADRLFAFDGQAAALRDRVDPNWRGAAPYVVLLSPHAPPRRSTGLPADSELAAWAAAGR